MIEKEELVAKITVTKEAEEAVSQIVTKVNDGFEAGRVNRQDVASWILTRFIETFSESEIQQIRSAFFNEIALLEAILKKAKQSGNVPAELKVALMGQVNVNPCTGKKVKRGLTKEFINDELKRNEEAA
ncbi:MAG: hypothetical protein ACXVCY_15875 [Pseudobdellovibrionaceae bacterium]